MRVNTTGNTTNPLADMSSNATSAPSPKLQPRIERIPLKLYGGTERVVSYTNAEELIAPRS